MESPWKLQERDHCTKLLYSLRHTCCRRCRCSRSWPSTSSELVLSWIHQGHPRIHQQDHYLRVDLWSETTRILIWYITYCSTSKVLAMRDNEASGEVNGVEDHVNNVKYQADDAEHHDQIKSSHHMNELKLTTYPQPIICLCNINITSWPRDRLIRPNMFPTININ